MNRIILISFLVFIGVIVAEKNEYGFERFLKEIPIKISDGYYYYKFNTSTNDKVTAPKLLIKKDIIPKIEFIKQIIVKKEYNKLRKYLYQGKLSKEDIDFYSRRLKQDLTEENAFEAMIEYRDGLGSGEFLNLSGLIFYGERILKNSIVVLIVEYEEDKYVDPNKYENEMYCVEFFDLSSTPLFKSINGSQQRYIDGKLCFRKNLLDGRYYLFGRDDINGHNLNFFYDTFLYDMILRDNFKILILDEDR